MGAIVICGGQYGSEGKGKVAYNTCLTSGAKMSVRVGGPNSGHTIYRKRGVGDFEKCVLRQLPAGALIPDVTSVLPTGSYLYEPVLFEEIEKYGMTPSNLYIDPFAVMIEDADMLTEAPLKQSISSTQTGTGAAYSRRVNRLPAGMRFAQEVESLKPFIRDTKTVMYRCMTTDKGNIVVEGTQGFGLSAIHSPDWPFTTARDTTASGILSEAGIAPKLVSDVIMVCRTYPIRVAGESGPLKDEITWEEITESSGSKIPIREYTSVTRKLRRVGKIDYDMLRRAVIANAPTKIVLNHLDYIAENERSKFLREFESKVGQKVNLVGLDAFDLVARRRYK